MFNLWDRLKEGIIRVFKSREFVVLLVFCLMTIILIQRVFYLQIVKGQEYLDDYKLLIQKTKEVQGTRGRILDRNGVVLADNKLAYSVTIEDNGDFSSKEEKNHTINETIKKVIDIVESNGDSIINNFKVVLNDNGEYEYATTSDTQRLRFLADVFGEAKIEKLKPKQREYTAEELITYLCTDKKYGYGIDQKKNSKEQVLKMVNIRYAMGLNRFRKYVATTIASDVSDETIAAIMENIDDLQGVNIEEDSIRTYPDSKYFASIIGYTGHISQDEFETLDKKHKDKYSLTDIIGKSGMEKTLDETLQGPKGEVKLYVNRVGKVIEKVEGVEAKAGNDVYLSIDAELQKTAYDLLEEKLAGILLSRIRNVSDYDGKDKKLVIPIDDVYYALFGNEVLNLGHFEEKDAKPVEKEVYASFTSRKQEVIEQLKAQLNNPNAPAYKDSSKEMQAYLSYVVNALGGSDRKVILKEKIDQNDPNYIAWKTEETINIHTYLNYALSKNWIDTSKLKDYVPVDTNYSDLNEAYEGLVKYICEKITMDMNFDKLIYKYMIKTQRITGRQACMLLYEQGVLEYNENDYKRLSSGAISAYDFIRSKIESLEITPGALGLEPSTASAVVTDTKTGQLLACVSYPGYDNNKLANSMDSAYFSKLIQDKSAPLYNNATQEKTAPGSTFKPISATAALTEGVITTDTVVRCTGVYDKAYGKPKCWIYPRSHGNQNVVSAIQHSCNIFFYDVGYRLGLPNGTDVKDTKQYSSKLGLERLSKYARLFGLDEQTGIEIPESDPQISDKDSIRSSIGQGTHNYTTTQLARYVTAVANKGTVYNLSLFDKETDKDGKVIEKFKPDVRNTIDEVSDHTWTAVRTGMRQMVKSSSAFKSLGDFELSGKTGTAQQSKSHANHGLFVAFAPSADPEIAMAVRIKYADQSLYASEVGRDITRYYYDLTEREELVTGHAAKITLSGAHGD